MNDDDLLVKGRRQGFPEHPGKLISQDLQSVAGKDSEISHGSGSDAVRYGLFVIGTPLPIQTHQMDCHFAESLKIPPSPL